MFIHLKSENNCYSIYMNKTFDGHTPNENGSLDLDRSDTHIHNIETNKTQTVVPQISCTIIINFASFGFNIMNMCITTIEIQRTNFIGCVTI